MSPAHPHLHPIDGVDRPWLGRSHGELARLTRELLLAGHLIDRASMPQVIGALGRETMTDIAIEEWVAASPVYSKRMQRLLGFEADTVEAIFKGMQLDIGAPPEFMDFRFAVDDDYHGRFWLDHCGALMDVEPMGDDYVVAMCHHIEDPTFDATAAASNPRAEVRPVHRPPREPADRHPHCSWTVTIRPEADARPQPGPTDRLAAAPIAALPLVRRPGGLATDDGWADYTAPLDPDLRMEHFASATLAAILDEVCTQGQLLSQGFLWALAERTGGDEVTRIGAAQLCGIAGLVTKRLAAALGFGADLDGVAGVLAVHPMFLPRAYVDLRLARRPASASAQAHADADADALVVSLGPTPATGTPDGLTWPALLTAGHDRGLASAVQCLAPRARVSRIEPVEGAEASWEITLDPDAEPAEVPSEVTLTEFSTGAAFQFQR